MRNNLTSARQTVRENNQTKYGVVSPNGTVTDFQFAEGSLEFSINGGNTWKQIGTKEDLSRVGEIQTFGRELNNLEMVPRRVLPCDGSIRNTEDYADLANFLGSQSAYGEWNANSNVLSFNTNFWRAGANVGTKIYYTNHQSSTASETKIGVLDTLTNNMELIDVPVSMWGSPIVADTSIYYTCYYSAVYDKIGKFDTLTQQGIAITVPSGNWSSYGTYYNGKLYLNENNGQRILVIDTTDDSSLVVDFSSELGSGSMSMNNIFGNKIYVSASNGIYRLDPDLMTLVNISSVSFFLLKELSVQYGTDVYFGDYYGTATTIRKLDLLTDTVSEITVPNSNWGMPVLVGTDIYFFAGIQTNPITTIGKFDILAGTGLTISVPSGWWQWPMLYGTNIFCTSNQMVYIYKFDILTQTGTQLTTSGSSGFNGSIRVGNSFYKGSTAVSVSVIKFDMSLETITQLNMDSVVFNSIVGAGDCLVTGFGFNSPITKLLKISEGVKVITVPEGAWYAAAFVGDSVYFTTDYASSASSQLGRLNIVTDTFTVIDVPSGGYSFNCIVVGTDIYFGNDNSLTDIGKFDTLTQTGERIPVVSGNWALPAALVGDTIYFTSSSSGQTSSIRKFNISTQTSSSVSGLASLTNFSYSFPVVIGTNMYFTSRNASNTGIAIYDTLTDTSTMITVPSGSWGRSGNLVLVGTDIYFGGSNTEIGKFDTLTQTGTLISIPNAGAGWPLLFGDTIFFIGTNGMSKFDVTTQTGETLSASTGTWSSEPAIANSLVGFIDNATSSILLTEFTTTQFTLPDIVGKYIGY